MRMRFLTGYLHTYDEAWLCIHALRLGFIEPKKERLTLKEREQLRSGSIFIFIEKKTSIVRWTDGMTWSPSKILGSFLLYKEVPKYLTKNASKKLGSKSLSRKKCIPLEKQLQTDRFYMHKKTISLKHENETYHVISYFQPIFDKRGISQLPFFISLQNALKKHPELYNDKFVNSLHKNHIDITEKYKILEFKGKNLMASIDRMDLAREAVILLSTIFNHKA